MSVLLAALLARYKLCGPGYSLVSAGLVRLKLKYWWLQPGHIKFVVTGTASWSETIQWLWQVFDHLTYALGACHATLRQVCCWLPQPGT